MLVFDRESRAKAEAREGVEGECGDGVVDSRPLPRAAVQSASAGRLQPGGLPQRSRRDPVAGMPRDRHCIASPSQRSSCCIGPSA